ncbi:MAG: WS/DGAT domain-containing protein, partial [Haliea sp.]|uniref:WS/DGAT domain-containing protein n=1 Tax=Haliea sp. TaxID=1932666 RepID=UPI0032EB118F
FNTVVTNVPGPPIQQYFCGARLVDALSLGPLLPNIGLFHVVYSSVQNKQGSVTLSFTACREMLPDPARYAECLQASFDELAALLPEVEPAPLPASRKKPRKPRRRAG